MSATPIKILLSCKEKNLRKSAKKSKNITFAMGYVYTVDTVFVNKVV